MVSSNNSKYYWNCLLTTTWPYTVVATARRMATTKEHSSDIWQVSVDLYIKGKGYRVIGKQLNLHPCTVGSIFQKWKKQDYTVNRHRTSAPRKLSSRAVSRIVRFVENHPRATRKESVQDLQTANIEVTHQTVSNALRQHGLRSCM